MYDRGGKLVILMQAERGGSGENARKSTSYRVFLSILPTLIVACMADIGFHMSLFARGLDPLTYVLRCVYHAGLFTVFFLFTLYITVVTRLEKKPNRASMVAYYLKNTISRNGHVTRGICSTDDQNRLVKVVETYSILPFPDGTIRDIHDNPEGVILDPDALVSMNLWGFSPSFFADGMEYLDNFLKDSSGDPLKKECLLPALVDTLMHTKGLQVEVLSTHAVWFGVTYKEDKAYVASELKKLHDNGSYPPAL